MHPEAIHSIQTHCDFSRVRDANDIGRFSFTKPTEKYNESINEENKTKKKQWQTNKILKVVLF